MSRLTACVAGAERKRSAGQAPSGASLRSALATLCRNNELTPFSAPPTALALLTSAGEKSAIFWYAVVVWVGPRPSGAEIMKSVPGFIRFFVSLELDSLREYVQTVDGALRNEFKRFDRKVQKQTSNLSEAEENEYRDIVSNKAWNLSDKFPALATEAAFISLCSFLRYQLVQIGRHLRNDDATILLKPEDVKGSGIMQAKKYLDEVCGIAFPAHSDSWKEIIRYMRLRNLIVQHKGIILPRARWDAPGAIAHGTLSKKVRRYAKSKKLITILGVECVRISRPFCLEAVETVRTFFNELFDALE
jgi:hypothetical protein